MGATTIHLFWYEIGNEGSTHESERRERGATNTFHRDGWSATDWPCPLAYRYAYDLEFRITRGLTTLHSVSVSLGDEYEDITWSFSSCRIHSRNVRRYVKSRFRSNKKITRYLFSLKRRVARDICLVYVKLLLVYSDVSYIVYPLTNNTFWQI